MKRELKFRSYLNGRMEFFGLHDGLPTKWSGWATVMQYTGLKDRLGKEIYEGDVYRIVSSDGKKLFRSDNKESIHAVEFYISQSRGNSGYSITQTSMVEIIGNIYENPELLTK